MKLVENKKTIEVSQKTFELLARWESLRGTVSRTLSKIDDYYSYIEENEGFEEDAEAEIKKVIAELQQLVDPLDEINAACKNRLARELQASLATRRR